MTKYVYPSDIYSESPAAEPDTFSNLGPLRPLAGTWKGLTGTDVNPKADGPEHNGYTETIEMTMIDRQLNGPQLFYGLRYHQFIQNPEEEATFHDQVGYFLWEPETKTIIQTLAIPRGQIAMAIGTAEPNAKEFELIAKRGSAVNGICSNPFLEEAFKTPEFRCKIAILSDDSWSYEYTTVLEPRGSGSPFDHIDQNTLVRVSAPKPNPLLLKVQAE